MKKFVLLLMPVFIVLAIFAYNANYDEPFSLLNYFSGLTNLTFENPLQDFEIVKIAFNVIANLYTQYELWQTIPLTLVFAPVLIFVVLTIIAYALTSMLYYAMYDVVIIFKYLTFDFFQGNDSEQLLNNYILPTLFI